MTGSFNVYTLDHQFYMFLNAETNETELVYRGTMARTSC